MSAAARLRGAGTQQICNPLTEIDWSFACWADDPDWARPADGGNVTSWDDATGGGNHLAEVTNPPTLVESSAELGGRACVRFDGSAQRIGVTLSDPIPAPWSVAIIGRYRATTAGRYIFGGGATEPGKIIGIVSPSGTPVWRLRWSVIQNSATAADTNPHLWHATIQSGSDVLGLDGTTIVSADAGSDSISTLWLGTSGSQGFAAVDIAFVGLYAGALASHPRWATFKAWAGAHHGFGVT